VNAHSMTAAEAAAHLGISTKALRLYEERDLLSPPRTAAGWRVYGPDDIARAHQIIELRALGLSLNEVAKVFTGNAATLQRALASQEAALSARMNNLQETLRKVHKTRADLDRGDVSAATVVSRMRSTSDSITVAFDLPWPWGGERFELLDVRRLTHIVGPLGSGKTRLAMRLAEAIPDALFVGENRASNGAAVTKSRLAADPALDRKVRASIAEIVDGGGVASDALVALFAALEADGPSAHVVDMLEQGLDTPTQEALIALLRRRAPTARPILFLTRSTAILDIDAVGPDEAIILCPANHSPPMLVAPHPGAPGFEALITCLATPEVRARTEGVVAIRRTG
jgi:DNA-binding transcriptional MerR regulator